MTGVVQVSTATETRDDAVALAGSAVKAKLAAGAQIIGPVMSVFWHLGEFGTGEEWQLLLKTTVERYPELEKHLRDNHPWRNPEICAVAVVAGAADSLRWVHQAVVSEPADG